MIRAFAYHKKRFKELKELSSVNGNLWISVISPKKHEIEKLEKVFGLHPTTVEDVSTHQTRIKYEEFDEYTLIVFSGIKEITGTKSDWRSIYFILGKNFLITICEEPFDTINNFLSEYKKIEPVLKKGADLMLYHILDAEIDKYLDIREKLFEDLINVENQILRNPDKELLDKLFKKEILTLDIKQKVESVAEVCFRLQKASEKFINNSLLPYYRDIYDHILRVDERLRNILDRLDSMGNAYMSMVSNKMNETIRVLTIITVIIMPLTFITGFYGMNILLPIQRNPLAWIILSVLMLVLMLIMVLIFKRKNWIGK
ncbi:hypothetical protein D6745_01355 [Candidatus Woesearchaeota archaeon]|nr:MAG: hypothetical protein D6745_01355 [Candidatus Woesearchaeota archaeon]